MKENKRRENIETLKEPVFLDIENPEIPALIKEQATEIGLDVLRSRLRDVKDYVVFASTAMYLLGKERGIVELQVPPGDFDAAVLKSETLDKIKEKLANVPGVEFDPPKNLDYSRTKILSGRIKMQVGSYNINYPFEFFSDTKIVNQDIFHRQKETGGFNTLTFEGLAEQYGENYLMELKIAAEVERVLAFLIKPETKQAVKDLSVGKSVEGFTEILKNLELSIEDLKTFYDLHDRFGGEKDENKKGQIRKEIVSLLTGGQKTKLEKRLKNLRELENIRKQGDLEV